MGIGDSDVKEPPVMWETWVQSLGWEDPLEKGMATTPVFWPGEFHGQRSLAAYSPWRLKELDMTEQLSLHLSPGNYKFVFYSHDSTSVL